MRRRASVICAALIGCVLLFSCASSDPPSRPEGASDRHFTAGHDTRGRRAIAIAPEGDGFEDLAFLRPLLEDKKVVLLGESSHGIAEFYELKTRLVRFLHSEMGFEVLAMETGLADAHLQWTSESLRSGRELRDQAVFDNYRCAEIMPLFDYLMAKRHSDSALTFAGFDPQNFASFDSELVRVLGRYDADRSESIRVGLRKFFDLMPHLNSGDMSALLENVGHVKRASREASRLFGENRSAIARDFQVNPASLRIYERAIKGYHELVDIDWKTENPSAKRDEIMAENLIWLMEELYPGKQFVVWAHNAHIDKKTPQGDQNKWMGQYIHERYGHQSYAVGLFAKRGESFVWFRQAKTAFDRSAPNAIENLLYERANEATFLDLSDLPANSRETWARSMATGFEIESGGERAFVPAERFDGLIVVNRATVPDYSD